MQYDFLDFISVNTEHTCGGRQASLQRICCVQSHVLWQDETEEQLSRFSLDEDKRSSVLSNLLPLEYGYCRCQDVLLFINFTE